MGESAALPLLLLLTLFAELAPRVQEPWRFVRLQALSMSMTSLKLLITLRSMLNWLDNGWNMIAAACQERGMLRCLEAAANLLHPVDVMHADSP